MKFKDQYDVYVKISPEGYPYPVTDLFGVTDFSHIDNEYIQNFCEQFPEVEVVYLVIDVKEFPCKL